MSVEVIRKPPKAAKPDPITSITAFSSGGNEGRGLTVQPWPGRKALFQFFRATNDQVSDAILGSIELRFLGNALLQLADQLEER